MDNQTAKKILSAYRPDGTDATDPVFQDALAQCERDPQMRASAMPLEYEHSDSARVLNWLEERGAPVSASRGSEV